MTTTNLTTRVTDNVLAALDGEAPPTFRPVSHPVGTAYMEVDKLRSHPDNPRNHSDTLCGVHVPSSIRADEMADAIQRVGDISRPLTVCGERCSSPAGTVLSGNRRLEGLRKLKQYGKLPQILISRGVPVDIKTDLSAIDESNILNDHGDTMPLNPTECFKAMLAMQAQGYTPEEIVFRHPGLYAGYSGSTLAPLPSDETERARWFDRIRDTLTYNVLSWGLFPAALLPARILLIQDDKEGAFKGQEKPVYEPFKPTAKRGKELYKAMREDKRTAAGAGKPAKKNEWTKDGGPSFNLLCVKFANEDKPSADPAAPVVAETVTTERLTEKEIGQLRDTVGQSVPIVGEILSYVETGIKPDGFHDAVRESAFAVALLRSMRSDVTAPQWKRIIPDDVYAAIIAGNVNDVQTAISAIPEVTVTEPTETNGKRNRKA